MRSPRLLAPVAVLALAGATVPALAGGADTRIEAASPHQVRGDLGAATGVPTSWAAKALRAQAGRLGVEAGAFRLESVRTSLIGTHVRGRQFRGDVPVDGTTVLVSAIAGRVAQVDAFGSSLPGAPAARPVGELVARAAALGRLGVRELVAPASVERLMVARGGSLVDTYRVSLVSAVPALAATVDVDAATGRVSAVQDDRRFDGDALLFDPNPIQSTGNTALRQPLDPGLPVDPDVDSPELTAARKKLPLKGFDTAQISGGVLTGQWVNIIGIQGYLDPGSGEAPHFDITRGDPRFEGLMAYAHIDRYQRYLQSLGFRGAKGVNAEAQDVVAGRVEGFDNSFYQPGNDLMLLGHGGVDDGEDAEVILHEYGHAVQDAQVKGWGSTAEGGAMGEGFGDFQSGAYFARTNRFPKLDVCLMEWDSTSYADGNPTCIRRMDVKKHYPEDVEDEVHADGELWSTYLWRVRSHIKGSNAQKSDAALRLVLTSHELLTPNANFDDAVAALRTAARGLRHPEWQSFINSEAKRIGFPLNP